MDPECLRRSTTNKTEPRPSPSKQYPRPYSGTQTPQSPIMVPHKVICQVQQLQFLNGNLLNPLKSPFTRQQNLKPREVPPEIGDEARKLMRRYVELL